MPIQTKGEIHVYDGIEELDEPIPRWFGVLFAATVVFSIFYFLYYHVFDGQSIAANHAQEISEAQWMKSAEKSSTASLPSGSELLAVAKNPDRVKSGHEIYRKMCLSCHGDKGQGGIGPNLTDNYWIHGGKPPEIAKTVTEGVLDKGMPAWGPMLKPDEVISVVGFVLSIQGTVPLGTPGAKEPQGQVDKD